MTTGVQAMGSYRLTDEHLKQKQTNQGVHVHSTLPQMFVCSLLGEEMATGCAMGRRKASRGSTQPFTHTHTTYLYIDAD